MASVTATTLINRPPEHVFNYVVDVANHLAWQAGILEARLEPAGAPAVGSSYRYTTEVMGRRMETALQISRLEANRTWGVTTIGVPNPVETVYTFEPEGDGTRLSINMELTGGYPAVAEPMIKAEMQKNLDAQCARIKQHTEA